MLVAWQDCIDVNGAGMGSKLSLKEGKHEQLSSQSESAGKVSESEIADSLRELGRRLYLLRVPGPSWAASGHVLAQPDASGQPFESEKKSDAYFASTKSIF